MFKQFSGIYSNTNRQRKIGLQVQFHLSTAAKRQTLKGAEKPLLMSSTKFGFRPRALDVTRKLPIRIRKCRKRSPKVKRTVALASSGMEKEEEMESHLQQALLAQKATSAGDSVENHVIPTPKVSSLQEDEYDRIYQQQRRFQKSKKLITFKEHVPFFLTQGSYNADSEDEEWLSTKRNINVDDFEHIIEKLETASQTDIIKPKIAKGLLQRYDSSLIDDVYDYWLLKRQKAASKKSKCPVLMPRVCMEVRREEKSIVNPYIAFRRRLDKVQTRKKQKTELMTYEKMLQINFTMKRSIVLANALAGREKLKRAACQLEFAMYQLQHKKDVLSNEEIDALMEAVKQEERQKIATPAIEAKQQHISAESITSAFMVRDFELPPELRQLSAMMAARNATTMYPADDKNLQRNLELWNAAALITPVYAAPSLSDDSAEVEKIAAVDRNSSIDGRYEFKRRHGCRYRGPIPSTTTNLLNLQRTLPPPPPQQQHSLPAIDELNTFQYFSAKFTQEIPQTDGSTARRVGFAGRRIGRGGRILIDLFHLPKSDPPPPPPNSSSDNRISSTCKHF